MHGSSSLIRSLLPGLTGALALAVAATVAHADQATAPESQSGASALQEIVVTAQKRVEKLHDVPMGITAVSSEDLQKQQLVSLDDLQAKVPGLSLTEERRVGKE